MKPTVRPVGVSFVSGLLRWQAGRFFYAHYLPTFLQNSQNREIRAFQLKLDEIIRATEGAKNTMVSLEKLNDEELARLGDQYNAIAEAARKQRPAKT